MHSIYHLAKADFLQRIRSFTFLLVLAACMYLTYTFVPAPDADYVTVSLGNYRGLYNAAWIGMLVAMMSSVVLTFFGFYLVNNSVSRDYNTGVGQIIATTQISKLQYLLGKALSNFLVFLSITAVVAVMATVMLYLKREVGGFNLWDLYSPFLYISLPAMFFIAAFAAFLETFRKVSKGVINILYFLLFLFVIGNTQSSSYAENPLAGFVDLFGVNLSFEHMGAELGKQVDDYNGGYAIGHIMTGGPGEMKTFTFSGINPSPMYLLYRFWWFPAALVLLVAGAFFFKRFDPAFDPQRKERKRFSLFKAAEGQVHPVPYPELPKPSPGFSFFSMVRAEWKLMLHGTSRLWWLVTLGLFITSVFVNPEVAHQKILLFLWAWQILLWSQLGSREKQHNTGQVIFSGPNVLSRQLFAGWTANVLWALALAAAVILRLYLGGEMEAVVAIITGAFFLPSLALFCGILSGGGKLFQVLYLFMAYAVLQNMPYLDYLGAVEAGKDLHLVPVFLSLSIIMLFFSFLGRRKQMYI